MRGVIRLKRARSWLIISVVGLLGTGAHWCRDFVRIDSCLDAGHVYNYVEEACDHTAVTLPVVRYEVRHPWVIGTGLGIALAGVGAALASAGADKPRDGRTS